MLVHRRLLRLWMLLAIAALLLSAFVASIRGWSAVADVPLWESQPKAAPLVVADVPLWESQPRAAPSVVADVPLWERQPV